MQTTHTSLGFISRPLRTGNKLNFKKRRVSPSLIVPETAITMGQFKKRLQELAKQPC